MENKKTLWIVLATGIFLLAVIGAAIILFAPMAKKNANTTTWVSPASPQNVPLPAQDTFTQGVATVVPEATSPSPAQADSVASSQEEPQNSAQGDTPNSINAENLTVYSQGSTSIYGTTISIGTTNTAVTPQNAAAQSAIEQTQAARTQTTNQNTTAGTGSTTKTTSAPAASTQAAQTSTAPAASSTKTTSASQSSGKTASSTTSAKTTGSSTASSSTGKTTTPVADAYWVQVAAYTTKKNADEARSLLENAQLPCEVFTHTDGSGKLYYRVRVGPYTTASEAKYWMGKITSQDEFKTAQPYVTNSSAPAAGK